MRGRCANAQRVAVARSARSAADTDRTCRACDILDHDWLTERAAHALADHARERIGRAARWERHDHGDRSRWIILRQ
jgi:hypothetical protein